MRYYVWLQCVLGAGNKRVSEIIKHYNSPKEIYYTDRTVLQKSGLFTKSDIRKMSEITLDYALKIMLQCKKNHIDIVCFSDEKFPESLKNIQNPPLVLYIKGNLPDFNNIPSICIIGPRKSSEYGKKAAYSLSSRLSRAGFIILSGGAKGIDAAAHTGALKYDGITVAVLGCGISNGYLPENASLREKISMSGCLISEYSPFSPVTQFSFPIRNRLLSALTLGTVVIEAPERSGALITASYALEQGKDVFVIPGNPGLEEYAGSNALLRDGAKPLLDCSDIFNEYILKFPDKISIEKAYCELSFNEISNPVEKNFDETLSNQAKIVYNYSDKQKFSPDDLLELGISFDEILAALTELEVEGYIKAVPGGQYCKL